MNSKTLAELTRWCNRNKITAKDGEALFGTVLQILTLREAGLTVSIPKEKEIPTLGPIPHFILADKFPIDINRVPSFVDLPVMPDDANNEKFRHLVAERWVRARIAAGHFGDGSSSILDGVTTHHNINRIAIIKAAREVLGLGLAEAKGWMEARRW